MPNHILSKRLFFNFLKLLWAVIIFYLWLKVSVHQIWEDSSILYERLYQTISQTSVEFSEDWQEMLWKHDVADSTDQDLGSQFAKDSDGIQDEYIIKSKSICDSNKVFCNKISFHGDFLSQDKYMYLATSIYILNHIDQNKQFGRDLKNQLSKIEIKKEVWARRGFANWNAIHVNLGTVSSYIEFMELLVHEMWHIIDLWVIRWTHRQKDRAFTEFGRVVFEIDDPSIEFYKLSWQSEKVRKAWSLIEDFCSGYGMTNPFEDFAECHNLYLNHNAVFRFWAQNNEIMKQKYNFMANLYGGVYMFDTSQDLQKARNNKVWRPWDTTKM